MSTNMRVLAPSRKRIRAGDVFIVQMADDRYVFGRVASVSGRILSMENVVVLYFYDYVSNSKALPPREKLRADCLLIPPVLTNRLGWSRGYFETVENWPLLEGDLLKPNCFQVPGGRKYVDEVGNQLSGPIGPVGFHMLDSFRTIDDRLSKALGMDLARD